MLTISLLGPPQISLDGIPVQIRTRKALGLLAYLAATVHLPSRASLATLFWPEYGESQSMASLRNTLWLIKKSGIQDDYFIKDNQFFGFSDDAQLWIDVRQFQNAVDQCQLHVSSGDSLPADGVALLEEAAGLYRGDFLAGFTLPDSPNFDDWQYLQGERFRRELSKIYETLVASYRDGGQYPAAINYARRLCEHDSLEEQNHCSLMELYAIDGQRAAALRQFETCRTILHDELDIAPSDETVALYEVIRSDRYQRTKVQPVIEKEASPALEAVQRVKAHIYHRPELIVERPLRLFGRADALDHIESLVAGQQRVLLTGLGGVGKSSLAATVASKFIGAYQRDVLWLEIGKANSNDVFEAVAHMFGKSNIFNARSVDEIVLSLRELILDRVGLVVLDDVWDERTLFQTMKAIPYPVPAIVTSRQIIPIEGEIVHLTGLNTTSCVELLSHHARANYQDDPAAAELCESLGFHPFAITIAGKHLNVFHQLTPASLMKNIADAPHTLKNPGQYAEFGREAVKDLLDTSYHALDSTTAEAFVLLGALATSSASVQLLACLFDLSESDTVNLLQTIQRYGLGEIHFAQDRLPQRFRLHDLTHSYVLALYNDHANAGDTLALAARAFVQNNNQNFDLLDFDRDNILALARQSDNKPALVDIMKVLLCDGYMDKRGHTRQLIQLAEVAIEQSRQIGEAYRESLHFMLAKLGTAYRERGELKAALAAYQDAAECAPTPNREATLLALVSSVRFLQGEDDYDDYLEQAYQIATTLQDDDLVCRVHMYRGINAAQLNKLATAQNYLELAVEVALRLDDQSKVFMPLYNLAIVQADGGNFGQSLSTLDAAYEIACSVDNSAWIAHTLSASGRAFHELDKRKNAFECFCRALDLYQKNGQTENATYVANKLKVGGYPINDRS